MATFPTYATILQSGYVEQRESALLRTEMEDGPPKQARIKSRVMVTRTVTVQLKSRADYQAFITWYAETINEGTDWFDWTDPVSGTVKQARFVSDVLQATPTGGMSVWNVAAKIETWG